jgi:hypothetical protein
MTKAPALVLQEYEYYTNDLSWETLTRIVQHPHAYHV